MATISLYLCKDKGLKDAEEYDHGYKLHYYSREWLKALHDILVDAGDERYHDVKAVL